MSDEAIITIDGEEHKYPMLTGSEGERAIDTQKLTVRTRAGVQNGILIYL